MKVREESRSACACVCVIDEVSPRSSTLSSFTYLFHSLLIGTDIVGIAGPFKLSIWVPTEAVGKVIGKKGAVIQYIQRETRTTCSINSSLSGSGGGGGGSGDSHSHLADGGESESRWSPIVIAGEPSRTLAAHNMIRDIVEGESESKRVHLRE